MILKYVLKNFSRRKVRTILMIISLVVSTGLIVTMSATVETIRQSNIDLIASAIGRFDLSLTKKDTSLNLFIPIEETAAAMLAANEEITAVHPRIQIPVEMNLAGDSQTYTVQIIGLDQNSDDIGTIEVKEGEYQLGAGQTAVFENIARDYGIEVGDTLNVAYAFPLPREAGQAEIAGASQRRIREQFTVSAIILQDGVTGSGTRGLILELGDLQQWLNLPGQAKQMLATVDPRLYETNNAELAALRVRDVARSVQLQLGDEYQYNLEKASALSGLAQAFLAIQALINTYGLISLGVVGLLVHTLVMTNVQEQRRDMAVLRILGGQRNLLFGLVIVEVIVIGLVGVGLGILLGQAITAYIVVPIIASQFAQQGINSGLAPQVTLTAVLPAVISAFVVLILSSIKPANEASRTKVMHAINPGVADNIQLEDLAQLRERRPDGKMFLAGAALMSIFALIASFQAIDTFGGPALQVMFVLLALMLLVLGLGLMFFITTVPFERLVLLLMRLTFPRLTYFARRNVSRGQTRNTLISLLVLFSGVLPSFLATQTVLEFANTETSSKLNLGAPVRINTAVWWNQSSDPAANRLKPSFVASDLATVSGFDQMAALSYGYPSTARDPVGLRQAGITVRAIDGDLGAVLFDDMTEFAAGAVDTLQTLQSDHDGVIISEGLAELLAVELGETIYLQGEGLDNIDKAQIIGIARRLPGIDGISRSRIDAQSGSTVLVSMPHFRQLVTELNKVPPAPDDPALETVLVSLTADSDLEAMQETMRERYGRDYGFWTRYLEFELEQSRQEQAISRIFLLVLTGISFTTAVFGVFAVIYVTIYARRIEIGMLKSMGMLRRELTGMLILESITMTLGAALAGITAGASMGYLNFYGQRILQQQPTQFAIDTTVMPFIVIMVVLASILGAAFSARRIVRKQAVDILRM